MNDKLKILTEADYGYFVDARFKPGKEVFKTLDAKKINLLHAAFGALTEVGELADAIKKHVFYDKPLDVQNAIEELGDIEFYLQALRSDLMVTRDETTSANVKKLLKRYPKGYSNEAAQARADKNEG